jgi:'Cold-shock' DNA-binding domain
MIGTVRWFNDAKGYGFIRSDDNGYWPQQIESANTPAAVRLVGALEELTVAIRALLAQLQRRDGSQAGSTSGGGR